MKCLTDSLKIQLSYIYGCGKDKLVINNPWVQKQKTGYDCGMFAIANMFEFVANMCKGIQQGFLHFPFIQGEMCRHLVKCLE